MGLSMDNFLRINDVPVDPPKPKTTPAVDNDTGITERSGNRRGADAARQDFEAAMARPRDRKPTTSPPTRSADTSASSGGAASGPDRLETPKLPSGLNLPEEDKRDIQISHLENRAASLNQNIDALGPSGGYATEVMLAELKEVEVELGRLQPSSASKAEEDGGGGNQQLTGDQLARKYAPVLVLPGGEYDLPGDPQEFIDNSRLRTDIGGGRDDSEQGNNINGDPSDEFTAADVGNSNGNGQFLDLADNRRNIGSEDAPIFYQFDDPDNPTRITYFFHYPYNDGPGPQNHEGDWEGITLALDRETGEPKAAFYSAHSNKHTEPLHFDDLEMYRDPETGEPTEKPLVYVASGSHASYPTPGNHQSDAPDASWLFGPILGDVINEQTLDDRTPNSFEEAAHIFDTGENLHDIKEQDFYPRSGEGVHWGEPGNADGAPLWGNASSGPLGPSEHKGHHHIADGSVTYLDAEQAYKQAEADYGSAERELRSIYYGPDSDGDALEAAHDRLVAAEENRDETKAELDQTKSAVLSEAEQAFDQAEADYGSAERELRSIYYGPNSDGDALEAAHGRFVAAEENRDKKKDDLDQIKDIAG